MAGGEKPMPVPIKKVKIKPHWIKKTNNSTPHIPQNAAFLRLCAAIHTWYTDNENGDDDDVGEIAMQGRDSQKHVQCRLEKKGKRRGKDGQCR